jgi:hypothetical protein
MNPWFVPVWLDVTGGVGADYQTKTDRVIPVFVLTRIDT